MGGDLNLKKSWHVSLLSNQTKVWQAEQKALEERKKIKQIEQERAEERQIEELQRLQEASGTGGKAVINPKIAWMYSGANAGPGGTTEEQESYLLGKRRVDNLILGQKEEESNVVKPTGEEAALATALNARQISVKAGLDPLLAIEKQKHASLAKLSTLDLARMRKQVKKEMSKKERKHRRDDDDDRSHHRRRRDGDEDRDRHSRRRDDDRDHGHRSRRRDDHEEDDHRSKRRRHSDEDEGYRSKRRSHSHSRSRSPPRRRHEDDRTRSRHGSKRDDYDDRKRTHTARSRSRSPFRGEPRHDIRRRTPEPLPSPPESQESERAAKLAAMQSSAAELEETRNRRLAEMEARDAAEKEREDAKRADKNNKYVGGLRMQAASVGLEGRLNRSRGGLERLDQTF
jgi:hypothetical protein